MVIDYRQLGRKLASERKNRRLTQEKLAEKTDLANNYISNIETGRSIPSLETLVRLCEALDITPNDLLISSAKSNERYMMDDISQKVLQCSPKNRRIINGIIDVLEKETSRGE